MIFHGFFNQIPFSYIILFKNYWFKYYFMPNNITFSEYQTRLRNHLDQRAIKPSHWSVWGRYYRRRIQSIYQFLIPTGMRVLEVGCGRGDLIASIKPSYGVGIDLSAKMVAAAEKLHPEIHFLQADVHHFLGCH
jgi:ubiquinone/menaquinone biosynthesis C-methylase UbiE